MNRRRFLGSGLALALSASTAGCLSQLGFETRTSRTAPIVEDRPDAVYVPSHMEGMEMAGTTEAGPYAVSLSYSFPHRFWLVTGTETERVEVGSDDSLHLMASLWDPETSTVLPTGNVTMEVSRDGERVLRRSPWSMLSQNMGFHFGDNVVLPGEGSYDVSISVGPVGARRTGAFEGRFGEQATAEFELEFDRDSLEEIPFQRLDDRAGDRGALEPMGMEMMPSGQLPEPAELPGRALGETTSGDGRFVLRALEAPPAGVDGDGTYLAVSARTPYNRYPLPFMGLSGRVSRDGEATFEGTLGPTMDSELGYHYGAPVGSIESGDAIDLEFGAPPQVSRHEGYETAFLEMEPASVAVE